ncbi:uncharacterized protein LOC120707276 isoform X2 [Panicum virgatum]|nr:uncharacterized protein LOC120707276 isoform X2 [Panicum virgatum]
MSRWRAAESTRSASAYRRAKLQQPLPPPLPTSSTMIALQPLRPVFLVWCTKSFVHEVVKARTRCAEATAARNKESWDLKSNAEKIEAAAKKKDEGNATFKMGKYAKASKRHEK